MYKSIVIALEGVSADRYTIEHMKSLAKLTESHVVVFHVASLGTGTRSRDALYPGAGDDVAYLRKIQAEFHVAGIPVKLELVYGDVVTEIVKRVHIGCDLLAMNASRRESFTGFIFGTATDRILKSINVPVLLIKPK